MSSLEVTLAIVAALLGGGGIGTLITVLAKRRKIDAETEAIKVTGQLEVTDRALEFNRELLQRIETLEAALKEDEEREDALERRIAKLEGEVRSLEVENRTLKTRVRELEAENARLKEEA
jgi:predicted nuclease with TOPRIM domain